MVEVEEGQFECNPEDPCKIPAQPKHSKTDKKDPEADPHTDIAPVADISTSTADAMPPLFDEQMQFLYLQAMKAVERAQSLATLAPGVLGMPPGGDPRASLPHPPAPPNQGNKTVKKEKSLCDSAVPVEKENPQTAVPAGTCADHKQVPTLE